MTRRESTINPENPEQKLEKFKEETGLEMEIISGTPVFTIETEQKNEAVSKIAQFFGENSVFRVINANFIDDAIKFGTDKGRVDEHDFRKVAPYAGFDVWGIEKQALEQGLKKSDVLCARPYQMFTEKEEFNFRGLGIPDDRAAVLIYDGTKLQEMEGSKDVGGVSDGYAFKDTKKKKEALLGIMKFRESLTEFEKKLHASESINDKIALLEKEVFQNLNTPDDLKKIPYIALNIVTLLHHEALTNTDNPSEASIEHINKLKKIADRLEYENRMIGIVDEMASQIDMTREAFATRNERKMDLMKTWPNFVIKTTQNYLKKLELDEKYKNNLTKVIEDAKKCKKELGI